MTKKTKPVTICSRDMIDLTRKKYRVRVTVEQECLGGLFVMQASYEQDFVGEVSLEEIEKGFLKEHPHVKVCKITKEEVAA